MTKRLITLFSVEFFFTYTASKVRWRTPLCFKIFGTSKIFMLSRGQRNFPSVFFGLPVLKNLVGNPFSHTQYFGYRNFLCMRTENQVFLPNVLCLTIPKELVVTTSKFQIIWDLEKFHAYHGFLSIFLSHSTEKLREEPSNVSESFKCQVSKNFMHKKVITRFPVENFLSRPEKFRWRTLRYIRKVRLSKNFMTKRLITLFSVEFFFTYTASKVRWRTPLCFKIFGTSKIFMLSRGQRNFPSVFLASQY